jgi:hypothetical protein
MIPGGVVIVSRRNIQSFGDTTCIGNALLNRVAYKIDCPRDLLPFKVVAPCASCWRTPARTASCWVRSFAVLKRMSAAAGACHWPSSSEAIPLAADSSQSESVASPVGSRGNDLGLRAKLHHQSPCVITPRASPTEEEFSLELVPLEKGALRPKRIEDERVDFCSRDADSKHTSAFGIRGSVASPNER